jgi:hypothetical protein
MVVWFEKMVKQHHQQSIPATQHVGVWGNNVAVKPIAGRWAGDAFVFG